jgi:hypothetical protein
MAAGLQYTHTPIALMTTTFAGEEPDVARRSARLARPIVETTSWYADTKALPAIPV